MCDRYAYMDQKSFIKNCILFNFTRTYNECNSVVIFYIYIFQYDYII